MTPSCAQLLKEANKISEMAADLQDRGLAAEAIVFALIAAQRIQAIHALESLAALSAPLSDL